MLHYEWFQLHWNQAVLSWTQMKFLVSVWGHATPKNKFVCFFGDVSGGDDGAVCTFPKCILWIVHIRNIYVWTPL